MNARAGFDLVIQAPMSFSFLFSLADQPGGDVRTKALLAGKGMRLDSRDQLLKLQPSWPHFHPLKNQDFSAAPYWLTRGNEAQPVHALSEVAAVVASLERAK